MKAIRRQLSQSLKGEDAVDVPISVPMIVVVMADFEIAHVGVHGDFPKSEVVLIRFERGLVISVYAAGTDQHYLTFRQWIYDGCPWRRHVFRPLVGGLIGECRSSNVNIT